MEENFEQKTKKTGKILSIVLGLTVLILAGILIYDKVIKKDDKPVDNNSSSSSDTSSQPAGKLTEVSLDDLLVRGLVYPSISGDNRHSSMLGWEYENVTVQSMTPYHRLENANVITPLLDEDVNINGNMFVKKEADMMANFIKIFGPDIEYMPDVNKSLNNQFCGSLSEYDVSQQLFGVIGGCSYPEGPIHVLGGIKKAYKAQKDDNNIYVYHDYVYVLSVYDEDSDKESYYFFNHYPVYITDYKLDSDHNKLLETPATSIGSSDNAETGLAKLASEGKTNKYKFTFRKQSDGKYYFYSGEVQ